MIWKKIKLWFHMLGSPPTFYRFGQVLAPWLWGAFAISAAIGLYQALYVVPSDYQQGDSMRILYIHVPAAWQALFGYTVMTVLAIIALIWRIRMTEIMAMACAPIGAALTLLCLATGSIWGKPMWGTWWVWDARLTSMLVLLFIYIGIMGLYAAYDDKRKGARVAAILVLAGAVNIPIIHFSVDWWNTLHQPATIRLMGESAMDASMLPPLLWMVLATKFFFGAALLDRSRNELLQQDRSKRWVEQQISGVPEQA
ncbi:MAG: heme ABC transporter permease [Wenzhouxiangellaceae bacterium]|nr:heme ABC transporter permease [Wenzhouxiangellaceae bacterium]